MFPVSDSNPTHRTPILTYLLVGINVAVFLFELTMSQTQLQNFFLDYSVVPYLLSRDGLAPDNILDVFRSMFFHGGWLHLIGNMVYLWIFGDNIEDRLGRIPFLILYFVSGIVAVISQYVIDPNSQIPLVGASGAIAGVLGSYLILFPAARVRTITLMGRMSRMSETSAVIVLGLWFVLQLFNGIAGLGVETGGGVAFFAHIGGFIAGVVLTYLLRPFSNPPTRTTTNNRSSAY
jgi:membrane associated rhomboid family serine protease